MKQIILAVLSLLAAISTHTFAQYDGWRHSGSLFILTTPEGADLPPSASETDFPLLVRLSSDFFDFRQAKPNGDDLRFSTPTGAPLPYQIEQWDAAGQTASIWVRIPLIKGNARQEIRLHWGQPDAASESSGKAVFNPSNGYLGVWHMNDPVKDEVGTLDSRDTGTTSTAGIVGPARHLAGKHGVFAGDKITGLPTGSSPHSSEAWFRAQSPNVHVLAWGNEQAQGKVTMQFRSPPHITMDCYFSDGNVKSNTPLRLSDWVHVAHTYQKGDARVYVNGLLDGSNKGTGATLSIKSPARLWIGGWYNNYSFVGDIDEVRVSSVVRSPDWVRLQYENQKPLQTLVGTLVQPGSEFSVSQPRLTVDEGKAVTVSAKADGAQKVCWILKRDGHEAVVGVDRLSFTFDAGRVVGDTSLSVQFKAIYPNEVKTRDIPILITEKIPEPLFTLDTPKSWDGRQTIEVIPRIANLIQMQASGAGDLSFTWNIPDFAVIKQITPEKLILKRALNSGVMTVSATLTNGGLPTTQSIQIAVKQPQSDPWVQRTPDKNEKPLDNQFFARDDRNEGTLYYNGTLSDPADSVFLRLYADDKLIKTEKQPPASDKSYTLTLKLKPGLIKYKVEFGTSTGGSESLLQTVNNLVCGDAYLIDGQSNALATDTREQSPPQTSEWIRSHGSPTGKPEADRQNLWCNPVWKARNGEKAELGYWGMELAKRLVESQKVPICIINAAVGGTRIDQHQRSHTNPTDLTTIYGRMLWRVQQARLTHGIRAVLWHQGENNQGSAAPTGDYDWKSYQAYFLEMAADWKQDFPNIQHYYVFQIWPNACSMAGNSGCGDKIREIQRTLPRCFSNLSTMSTLGIKPPGGCHFPLAGWAQFATLIQPLIERDHYGRPVAAPITPPNLSHARCNGKDEILLGFDQPVVWMDSLVSQFYLDGEKGKVAAGSVSGNVLTLKLKEPTSAKQITYLKESAWSQENLLWGANGIAALTFCDVPIQTLTR